MQNISIIAKDSTAGGFSCGSDGKESICRRKRCGFNPWVGKIPWKREWLPTLVFLLEKLNGQRSLVGYSLWCHKELDTTEQLSTHTHYSLHGTIYHTINAPIFTYTFSLCWRTFSVFPTFHYDKTAAVNTLDTHLLHMGEVLCEKFLA